MSRLQKKCLIASGTLHALLVLILLTSSAFLLKQEEPVDQQVLNFIPDKLVDAALQRPPAPAATVQPSATPPQTAPPQVTPPPQRKPEPKPEPKPPEPKPEPRPEPRKEPVKPPVKEPVKPDPVTPKVTAERPKPKPVEVDTSKRVVRSNEAANRNRETQRLAEEARARQAAEDQRREALKRLEVVASKLGTPNVDPTSLDLGTVGVSYASLNAWIRKVYMESWQKPADMQSGDFSVSVKVVIRRDGTVESSSVVDPSGIAKLDKSVRDVLARVKTIGKEFPEGAREEKRTYTIEFNLKATTGAG